MSKLSQLSAGKRNDDLLLFKVHERAQLHKDANSACSLLSAPSKLIMAHLIERPGFVHPSSDETSFPSSEDLDKALESIVVPSDSYKDGVYWYVCLLRF